MSSKDISKTEYFDVPVASTRDAALGPKRVRRERESLYRRMGVSPAKAREEPTDLRYRQDGSRRW